MFFNFLSPVLFLSALLLSHPAATVHKDPAPAPAALVIAASAATTSAADLIKKDATKYGVDEDELYQTLQCESGLHDDHVGLAGELGVAQIYLPAHPDITKAQALDERFSIDFAARSFATGYAHWWTCYRELYQ